MTRPSPRWAAIRPAVPAAQNWTIGAGARDHAAPGHWVRVKCQRWLHVTPARDLQVHQVPRADPHCTADPLRQAHVPRVPSPWTRRYRTCHAGKPRAVDQVITVEPIIRYYSAGTAVMVGSLGPGWSAQGGPSRLFCAPSRSERGDGYPALGGYDAQIWGCLYQYPLSRWSRRR
jgi:hypothetical protein